MVRILLADDNPEILSALNLLLDTRLGLEIITESRDMGHVLAQVEESKPDGIILDWNLPGRPVGSRIAIIKALVPTIKVVVINTQSELRAAVLAEGADAFILKTDPPVRLLDTIQALFTIAPKTNFSLEENDD